MGCDIHGHIEVRYHTDTNWYHSVPIEGKRCYNIFARLADVRNYGGVEAFNPRGFPKDISRITYDRFSEWKTDAHSCSFVSVDEFEEILNKAKTQSPYGIPVDYKAALAYMKAFVDDGYEVRLVFWFDN